MPCKDLATYFFWIAHIIYLIDFGVPKMVILVFLLGVIRGGMRI